ncbi:MAG: hypothetical protein B0A82_04965 [Alkalinema sp. CACIAM 70d]|nr:MAG: hypothetical protein B0A82_04965 [Alkalinema sp. CACIAM 70d]
MKVHKQLKNSASAFVISAATLTPMIMAATPASAVDLFFPASLCQPSTANDVNNLAIRNDALSVIGNVPVGFVCPIHTSTLITKHRAIVKVTLAPNTSITSPTCTLRSFGRDSKLLDSSSTSISSDLTQMVTKPVIPGNYHTLACTLPPGSRLFNYRLVE